MQVCGLNAFTNEEAIEFLNRIQHDEVISNVGEVPGTRALWPELSHSRQALSKIGFFPNFGFSL